MPDGLGADRRVLADDAVAVGRKGNNFAVDHDPCAHTDSAAFLPALAQKVRQTAVFGLGDGLAVQAEGEGAKAEKKKHKTHIDRSTLAKESVCKRNPTMGDKLGFDSVASNAYCPRLGVPRWRNW